MLKQLIESETRESIALRNRIAIEVHTASFPQYARLHHHCCAARRGRVLANGRVQRRARRRGDQRGAPRYGYHRRCYVAVRLQPACTQGRSLVRVREALRQGRRSDPGVAAPTREHEQHRAAELHRRPHDGGRRACERGVSRRVQERSRSLRLARGGRGLHRRLPRAAASGGPERITASSTLRAEAAGTASPSRSATGRVSRSSSTACASGGRRSCRRT